jgi:class 3 adenylate cyclase
VRERVREQGGVEVKSQGDGFMIAFDSARRAVQCAVAIQRANAETNGAAGEPIQLRAGLHTGDVMRDAGDFYGKHVNLAARIAAQARPGEILVSAVLKSVADGGADLSFEDRGELELKGLSGTHGVFAVAWQ